MNIDGANTPNGREWWDRRQRQQMRLREVCWAQGIDEMSEAGQAILRGILMLDGLEQRKLDDVWRDALWDIL